MVAFPCRRQFVFLAHRIHHSNLPYGRTPTHALTPSLRKYTNACAHARRCTRTRGGVPLQRHRLLHAVKRVLTFMSLLIANCNCLYPTPTLLSHDCHDQSAVIHLINARASRHPTSPHKVNNTNIHFCYSTATVDVRGGASSRFSYNSNAWLTHRETIQIITCSFLTILNCSIRCHRLS